MKTTFLIVVMLFNVHLSSAVSSGYEETMTKNIDELYASQTIDEYQAVVNKFDRIAAKESDKWEPLYYAGFGYIMMATNSEEAKSKDKYLDLALAKITKGMEMFPQESELVALEGFVHMMRVTVDPATRGPQYSGLSMQSYGKALALNPDNPRALFLMGQMEYGTAQFFGSDTTEACERINSAVGKFETYVSDNPLAPAWGKGGATAAAEKCK